MVRNLPHILMILIAAALLSAAGLLCASNPAFADTSEKADPVITYTIPKDLDLSYDSFNLNARTTNCSAELTYSSSRSDYLQVDQNGLVTLPYHETAFGAVIIISVPETETTRAKDFRIPVDVNWIPQKITCKSTLSTTLGKPVAIQANALGKLSYTSSKPSTAKVSSTGKVTFLHPGTVTIHVYAENIGPYWCGEKDVRVSCRMTAPKLKVTRPKRGCAKLTWSKVGGAHQYMIYVKYPGKKKYKAVLSKSAKVKSITHKGLKKGKKYSYKVRAYVICDDGIFYGPFSKAKTVKIQ